jgi:linoleoyl-CoA desaturase
MQKATFEHTAENKFSTILSSRIDAYFREKNKSRKANGLYVLKALSFFMIAVLLYAVIITDQFNHTFMSLLFILLGLFIAMFVFTVAHDASHHAISNKKRVNQLLEYVWDAAGISSYFWKLKHNVSHHGFTNIPGKDCDIDQSGLVVLHPHSPRKWFHRYQHIYAPFLYSLLSLNIIYIRDFKLMLTHEFGNKIIKKHPIREMLILFAGKLFFISYMIVIPKFVLHISWFEILGYHLMMNLAIGLFIGFVLVPVHVTEAAAYRLPDNKGLIHCDWSEHQIEATVDFSAGNYFVNWITGGLNTHVAHHLFPGINHIHYYQLTKIIRKTAEELNVPYRNYSWYRVFVEHLVFLKTLGSEKRMVSQMS